MEEKIQELEAIIRFLIENNPGLVLPSEDEKAAVIQKIKTSNQWNDGETPEW